MVTDAQGRFSTLVLPGRPDSASGPTKCPRPISCPRTCRTGPTSRFRKGPTGKHSPHPGSAGRCRCGAGWSTRRASPPRSLRRGFWTSAEYGRNPNSNRVETDGRGEFVMGNIAPKSEVKLLGIVGIGRRVRAGDRPHGRRGRADHAPAHQAADPGSLRPGAWTRRTAAGRCHDPGQAAPIDHLIQIRRRIHVSRVAGCTHRSRWPI